MKLDRIIASVREECGLSDTENSIRITVSALRENSALPELSRSFKEEAGSLQVIAEVITAGSCGYFDLEPLVRIDKAGVPSVLYGNISPKDVPVIIEEYLVKGNPIDDIPDITGQSRFSPENRVALRNCGCIDPENIAHYLLYGQGYSGLAAALEMTPSDVIVAVKKSGLRGKGGAGFSTGDKWQICSDAAGNEKYVVCNAVDADPNSLTAKLLLEGDPHSVLEGVLIAAYAVHASKCYICLNATNATGIERLGNALEQAKTYGLAGENVMDSGFGTEIEIVEVQDSLVSGEETALIRAIEGRQPMPYLRMAYPAVEGVNGRPTLVNSIETLSTVSAVFQQNAEVSTGTKVITLSGNVKHACTVEVPFGTTLERIVMDIGGGTADGKGIKAVRVGGPTGAYIDALDTILSYESMEESGSVIGSGGIRIIDTGTCAVEMLKDVYSYLQAESCGKCVFCREGTMQIADILGDMVKGQNKPGDMDVLTGLCEAMREGSICNLGTTASAPFLSSIRLFAGDFESHIRDKKCPHGKD